MKTATREPLQGLRRHKLLPAEVTDIVPMLYSQDGKGMDAIVYLKLFSPYGRMTLYITEGAVSLHDRDEPISLKDAFSNVTGGPVIAKDSPERIADIMFFGYMISPLGPDCDELGYSSFNELASAKVFGQVPAIERDCHFEGGKLTVRECLERQA